VKENILFGRPFLVAGAKSRVVGIFSHTRMVLNIGILKLMSSNEKDACMDEEFASCFGVDGVSRIDQP